MIVIKVVTIVGARPQFIKAAMLSNHFKENNSKEVLVHTGQHYDSNMSSVFFNELVIPRPNYHLQVGSDTHGKQTGKMLLEIESILMKENPDVVLVYGDTNSTLAGALAACKLHIPIAHVESGLRSYNRKMPEEVNRVLTDHVSTWLFCPTHAAVKNLSNEGINKGVHLTGDIMYDALIHYQKIALSKSDILTRLDIKPGRYYVSTIHRAENTDDKKRLKSILEALNQLDMPVILPLHPRTKERIKRFNLEHLISTKKIKVMEPVSYIDMIALQSQAKAILTDSGGVQKEAYLLGVPCITLRDETEWGETVDARWNQITGADTQKIIESVEDMYVPSNHPNIFGDGTTTKKIYEILLNDLK